mmetsp:Transcript_18013/g.55412  ORF Transcript_18013/g.55412 Transcript_18013/m.55412 type:complete len:258 (-) Transcript_18013:916-1689(-)
MAKSELHRRKMAERAGARDKKVEPEQQPAYDSSSDDDSDADGPARPRTGKKSKSGIKWKYVAFLVLLFGSAAMPVVLFLVDNLGGVFGTGATAAFGAATARMGLTPTPKDRLQLFYEKHNPEKVDEVDHLIDKYAGSYPKMVKVLEAKYGDYGFFLGWEQDRTFKSFLMKEAGEWSNRVQFYYKKYVPYKARVAFYKMYSVLDQIFRPYVDFIRARLLDFFPELKDYIGVPPYYRKPRSSSRRSSSSPKTKRKTGRV